MVTLKGMHIADTLPILGRAGVGTTPLSINESKRFKAQFQQLFAIARNDQVVIPQWVLTELLYFIC
jgi:hypothetical protein